MMIFAAAVKHAHAHTYTQRERERAPVNEMKRERGESERDLLPYTTTQGHARSINLRSAPRLGKTKGEEDRVEDLHHPEPQAVQSCAEPSCPVPTHPVQRTYYTAILCPLVPTPSLFLSSLFPQPPLSTSPTIRTHATSVTFAQNTITTTGPRKKKGRLY